MNPRPANPGAFAGTNDTGRAARILTAAVEQPNRAPVNGPYRPRTANARGAS